MFSCMSFLNLFMIIEHDGKVAFTHTRIQTNKQKERERERERERE